MKKKNDFKCTGLIVVFAVILFVFQLRAERKNSEPLIGQIEETVRESMESGNIPGLSLVIVRGDKPVYMKGFGYADLEEKRPVTPDTRFELASLSKAFTGLAALKCEADGLLNLDEPVSKYLPWFYANYKGRRYKITTRQLLHQTSGIPTRTISDIPPSDSKDALEQVVKNLAGVELFNIPGKEYRYATINYDIVGAVIESVTGMPYEEYMAKNLFRPLGLTGTLVGREQADSALENEIATGYKIGFFKARKYQPPIFRGNNPAGYIISNGKDMARWLQLHLGLVENDFNSLIQQTHRRDKTVPPDTTTLTSYAMGWQVYLNGSGMIWHGGSNPNFTTFIMFNWEDKIGAVVMANSNSRYTTFIGHSVMNLLYGQELPEKINLADSIDKTSSMLSFALGFFLLFVIAFYILLVVDILKGKRRYEPIILKKVLKLIAPVIILLPFLFAIYLLPFIMANVSWETTVVWSPISFPAAVGFILLTMAAAYLGYVLSVLFPHQNKYMRSVPMLIILSFISGGANAAIIFLVTISLFSKIKVVYLLYYFVLALVLYIFGRKVLQTRLIGVTLGIIYELRIKLIEKIFNTTYQNFEKIERGRIFTTLNDDTNQVGGSANVFVALISSIITVIGVFIYLASIAFWATAVTLIVVGIISALYYVVGQKANVFYERARDTLNQYMGSLTGLEQGYKELSLHYKKKIAYKGELEGICDKYRNVLMVAGVRFVNTSLIGESLLIIVLGAVGFAIPIIFPLIKTFTLMSFIMALLYLIGPINGILNAIPGIMQIRVAWKRIQQFMRDVPSNMDLNEVAKLGHHADSIERIEAKNVFFQYEAAEENEKFTVGPLDFEANKGEIVFIIGGNGSGKTTLAKLLTGLYIPGKGSICIDGKTISNHQLSEYFSVVFDDFHLFEKLYDVDLAGKDEEVQKYLELLKLKGKVSLEEGAFSTLRLSGGQRKRLALLRCYLEDRPIYLFDELAADQDPGFRKFFYRDLLQKMKEKGKTVIAITHDDHYFDMADRVIKMDMGKIDTLGSDDKYRVTA